MALCNEWPRDADGAEIRLTAAEAQRFFDPAQPPMAAARAAVQEMARHRANECLARERGVYRLFNEPVDDSFALAESMANEGFTKRLGAAVPPLLYTWHDAVRAFQPGLVYLNAVTQGTDAAAVAWARLCNMWPRDADGDEIRLTAEEALAFFDPAQRPRVAARAAACKFEQGTMDGILAQERETLRLLGA